MTEDRVGAVLAHLADGERHRPEFEDELWLRIQREAARGRRRRLGVVGVTSAVAAAVALLLGLLTLTGGERSRRVITEPAAPVDVTTTAATEPPRPNDQSDDGSAGPPRRAAGAPPALVPQPNATPSSLPGVPPAARAEPVASTATHLWLTFRREDLYGRSWIWIMRFDGHGSRMLAAEGATAPTWAPNGYELAYIEGQQLITTDVRNGSHDVVATFDGTPNHPEWSPDGRTIALQVRPADGAACSAMAGDCLTKIVVVDVATGARRVLTPGITPSWSPDGRRLVYAEPDLSGCAYPNKTYCDATYGYFATIGVDGSGRESLGRLFGGFPSFSPDGSRLAWEAGDGAGGTDILIAGLDGSQRRELGSTVLSEWEPAWTPDGRIAFVQENRDGAEARGTDIFVVGLDNQGKQQITSGGAGYDDSPDVVEVAG